MSTYNNDIHNNNNGNTVDIIDIEEGSSSHLPSSHNSSSDVSSSHNDAADQHDNSDGGNPFAELLRLREAPPSDTLAEQSGTVENIDDDHDGMPLTPDMVEAISYAIEPDNTNKQTGRVDIMDGDDTPVPLTMLQDSLNAADDLSGAAGKSNKQIRKVNIGNEGEDDGPTHPAEFEDNYDEVAIAKKKVKEEKLNESATTIAATTSDGDTAAAAATASDGDTIYVPTIEDMERDERQAGINVRVGINDRVGSSDIEAQAAHNDTVNTAMQNDEEEGGIVNNNDAADNEGVIADTEDIPLSDQSTLHIPEAFLVEERDEETVYDATPLEPILPWWKQRRTRILLGIVVVLLATLAIALGVTLSSSPPTNTITEIVTVNFTPSPSVSMVPTSSPTTCVQKVTENMQPIDLQKDLQIDDPYDPKVAIVGRNMVVVAKDRKYYNEDAYFVSEQYDGPVFTAFYSMGSEDDKWQRIHTIRHDNVGHWYDAALSGATAFFGFPYANDGYGLVLVYEQNQFGEWEKVDDPFIHGDNAPISEFGLPVDIDGDLACVGDGNSYTYLYHRKDGNRWVQFDMVVGWECSISGEIITVSNIDWDQGIDIVQLYKYNQDTKGVTQVQDPIPAESIRSFDLSKDYFVYWDIIERDAFVYNRDDKNQSFTFYQQLNITGPKYNLLALHDDILVVAGLNHTHIFSLQNDEWAETITLDQSFDDYQLSERTLIATTEESAVYSFNIQDCVQAMPTQAPTISAAPSLALSSHPSFIPTSPPSLVPSSSVSPSKIPTSYPSMIPSSSPSPTTYWRSFLWRQQGLAISGDSAEDNAGSSVAISGDGRTLVVGSPGAYLNDDRAGYVKVYYKQFNFASNFAGWKWQLIETFTGKESGDEFGSSVSISDDGKSLAIGAPENGSGYQSPGGYLINRPGYTRVYTRKDDRWTQLGDDIEGETLGDDPTELGDQSGGSVALSSDGKTVAIGANWNDGVNGESSGHVRVYTFVEGGGSDVASWKQVGQDIDGEAKHDYLGSAVSLSADGRTVAIGAPSFFSSGHVQVYSLIDDDEWKPIGQHIDGENEKDRFGTSVSMSSDGRMVAVGARHNDDNGYAAGKVQVYSLNISDSDNKWVQIGQDLIGKATEDLAGWSISLSSDGKTLATGATQNQVYGGDGSGYVRVYRLEGSADDSLSWTQFGNDINGVNAGDQAGSSVALSSDGKVVVVGSPRNDDNGRGSGHVRVFGV